MTHRQRVIVFTLAGVFALAGVATFGLLVWKQVQLMTDRAPVSAADRRLVITASDLAPYGAAPVIPEAEELEAIRQLDGSRHVQYNYETSKFGPSRPRVFIQSMAFVTPGGLAARQMFHMQKIGVRAGLSVGGRSFTISEAPQLAPGGDDRYAAILLRDGAPAGNLFVLRQGRFVYSLILAGIVITDPDTSEKLFAPLLAEAKRRAR